MTLHGVNRAQSNVQRIISSRPTPTAIKPAVVSTGTLKQTPMTIDARPSTTSVMAEISNPAHKPPPPPPPPLPSPQARMSTIVLPIYGQRPLNILTVQDAVGVLAVAAGYSTVIGGGGPSPRASCAEVPPGKSHS